MAEYIDREKVMEEIHRIGGHNLCGWDTIGVKALIDRQPIADVVPRSEVEALIDERDRYKRYYFNHAYDELVDQAKQEVAKELLDEIETKINSLIDFYRHHTTVLSTVRARVDAYFEIDDFISELKKKYIGEEK